MADKVCVPDAALVPDQPPLALQLVAVGLVDQVSRGVSVLFADVGLTLRFTTPAVCALAAPVIIINALAIELAVRTFLSMTAPAMAINTEAATLGHRPHAA